MDAIPLENLVPSDVPLAQDFVSKFLLYDEGKRLTAKEVVSMF